jgi:hypothetical protein
MMRIRIQDPGFFLTLDPGSGMQCCGTGTVGTVTFCLVEPEP